MLGAARPLLPRSDVIWLRRQKYLALLVALMVLIVVYPTVREIIAARLVYDGLTAVVLLVALLTVFTARKRLLAVLLGVPLLVGLWTGYTLPWLPCLPVVLALHAGAAVSLVFAVYVILADV